jgi:hypothetical protein
MQLHSIAAKFGQAHPAFKPIQKLLKDAFGGYGCHVAFSI